MKKGLGIAAAGVVVLVMTLLWWGRSKENANAQQGRERVASKSVDRPGGRGDGGGSRRGRRSEGGAQVESMTWDELRSMPVIALEGGGTARVGVEASSAPVGGGVLVYCLVEFGNVEMGGRNPRKALGPLECRIERPGPNELNLSHALQMQGEWPVSADGEYLFAKAVSINAPGDHRIVITRKGGEEVVAEMIVRGVESDFHQWVPFRKAKRRREATDSGADDGIHQAALAVGGIGPALPTVEGMMPIARVGAGRELAVEAPLPRLVPERPDEGLTIRVTSDGFFMESDQRMIVARPDWHLLARWWVNGEPFVPDSSGQFADANGRMVFGRRMDVALEFDPEVLDAKPGDRIGLQVMHLPNGWSFTHHGLEKLHPMHEHDDTPISRMSNRVEFVAP